MSIKFTKLAQILVITTIASLFSVEVMAQTEDDSNSSETISLSQAFKDAYFTRGKDAYEQSGYLGQINAIFGFTGFPEQHISQDGQAVNSLYRYALQKQTEVGSPIMTRDLANPYDTSLLENPDYISVK
ncbi:MAG: serine/threonine protein kinase [Pleurocapsa sp.]